MEKEGLSQTDLAKKSGIAQGRISQILSGRNIQLRIPTLHKLARAFNITVDELIGEKSNEIKRAELADNPDVQRILKAMPPEAKAFFRLRESIHPDDVDAVIRFMKMIVEKHEKEKKVEDPSGD